MELVLCHHVKAGHRFGNFGRDGTRRIILVIQFQVDSPEYVTEAPWHIVGGDMEQEVVKLSVRTSRLRNKCLKAPRTRIEMSSVGMEWSIAAIACRLQHYAWTGLTLRMRCATATMLC